MKKLIWLLVLAGCAGNGPGSQKMHQPVSQQAVVGEARTRAKTHTELGEAYYQDKQLSTALDEARKAVALDGNYAPARQLLALIYMDLGEKKLAEESFDRSLQLAPGDPDFSNNYGFFLCKTGQEQRAMQYFQAALDNPLYSTPSVALFNSAVCSVRLKDDKSAERFLLRVLQLEPGNTRALYQIADLYLRNARFGEAKLRISELHSRKEPSAESTWLALRIARGLGNRQDEAAFISALRRKFPASAEYQIMMQGQYQ